MKKALSLILILVLCLGLCACDEKSDNEKPLSEKEATYVGTWVLKDTGVDVMRIFALI